MENLKDLGKILQGDSALNQIFQVSRIINLKTHDVCKYVDGKVIPTDNKCFCLWDEDKACTNCVSYRVFTEQKQMVKLQNVNGFISLILAIPIEIDGEYYILELIKDLSVSLVVHDNFHQENIDIGHMVDKLNMLAVTDPFTNLYNKKYVEKQLHEDISFTYKSNENIILAMLDIDEFKSVNDNFGHVSGDFVIKELVGIIHKRTENHKSWAARYGGDEFLITFYNNTYENVKKYCDDIMKDFSDVEFHHEDQSFHSSVSIGIYEYDPKVDSYETLLNKVDAKMYEEKKKKQY
jgi:diguanylate cyclase (GGDEF)-like protein